MSLVLYIRIYLFRAASFLASLLDRYCCPPVPSSHEFELAIVPTLRTRKEPAINLLFYTPPGYSRHSEYKYPLVVNFHGGGYTIGNATNDARWAQFVTSQLNAVFVSVEYALAPELPYPAAIEDGADAIRWLWEHASNFALDASRTVATGFSAGAGLSLTAPLRLHEETKRSDTAKGRLVGICSFYPGVDSTQSHEERLKSNPISEEKGMVSLSMYRMFWAAYLGEDEKSRPDSTSPYLSPARASSDLMMKAWPEHMALYTCDWDQLLVEGEAFRERLKGLGKEVGGYKVEGVPHGFDKIPKLWKADPKRDQMYQDAVKQIKKMLAM